MRRFALSPQLLEGLRCPACRSPLTCTHKEAFEFGKVQCSCSEYPVIAGVIILQRRELTEELLAAIDAGEHTFLQAMVLRAFNVPGPVLRREVTSYSEAIESYVKECPMSATADFEWLLHAKYWNATPKSLAATRLTSFVRDASSSAVLDLASGFGHLSRLYRDALRGRDLYLVDRNLLYLMLAAWVLDEDQLRRTCMVAMNVESILPMQAGLLGLILNSDSFFSFHHQRAVLRSCGEALSTSGRMLFTHLHNRERPDEPFQLRSYDRDGWRRMFEEELGREVTIVSDDALRASLRDGSVLHPRELGPDNPRSFSVLAPSVKTLAPFPERPPVRPELVINPVYRVEAGAADSLRLSRRQLSRLFEEEHEVREWFPDITLARTELTDENRRAELLRQGVLVDANADPLAAL